MDHVLVTTLIEEVIARAHQEISVRSNWCVDGSKLDASSLMMEFRLGIMVQPSRTRVGCERREVCST